MNISKRITMLGLAAALLCGAPFKNVQAQAAE
mgnify:CR=1 FL=1